MISLKQTIRELYELTDKARTASSIPGCSKQAADSWEQATKKLEAINKPANKLSWFDSIKKVVNDKFVR